MCFCNMVDGILQIVVEHALGLYCCQTLLLEEKKGMLKASRLLRASVLLVK